MQWAQEATDTRQDTTSLPQYHKHACVSYLSETAAGSSMSPCSQPKAALCKQQGGRALPGCPGAALAAQLGI